MTSPYLNHSETSYVGFGAGAYFQNLIFLNDFGIKHTFTTDKTQVGLVNNVEVLKFEPLLIRKNFPRVKFIIFSSLLGECETLLKSHGFEYISSQKWHESQIGKLLEFCAIDDPETLDYLARTYCHLGLYEDELRIRLELVKPPNNVNNNFDKLREVEFRLRDRLKLRDTPSFLSSRINPTIHLEELLLKSISTEYKSFHNSFLTQTQTRVPKEDPESYFLFFLGAGRLNGITMSGLNFLKGFFIEQSKRKAVKSHWKIIICKPLEVDILSHFEGFNVESTLELLAVDEGLTSAKVDLDNSYVINDGSALCLNEIAAIPVTLDLESFFFESVFVYSAYRNHWVERLSRLSCRDSNRYLWIHNNHLSEMIKYPNLKEGVNLLRFYDSLVFVSGESHSQNRALLNKIKYPFNKCKVQTNLVNPAGDVTRKEQIVSKRDRALRLLFVGRLNYDKRPDLVVDYVRKLYEIYPKLTLDMVGDGPIRAELEARLKSANVKFISIKGSQHGFNRVHWDYDALIVLSEREGLPMVALEALGRGLWVISGARAGLSYLKSEGFQILDIEELPPSEIITKLRSVDVSTTYKSFDFTAHNSRALSQLATNFFKIGV